MSPDPIEGMFSLLTGFLDPSGQVDEHELLDRIAARDEAAVEELFDRYNGILFSFVMRILQSVEDTEEVLQDIFLQIWNKGSNRPIGGKSVYSWLMMTTRNRAMDRLRYKGFKRQSHEIHLDRLILSIDQFSAHVPASAPFAKERKFLADTLKRLSAEQQQVLALAYYEGYTVEEIAVKLKIAEQGVKTDLRKGLMLMRSIIHKNEPLPPAQHDAFLNFGAAHLLGSLTGTELHEYEMHLKTHCPICPLERERMMEAASLLPAALPQVLPPPELRHRILFQIGLAQVVHQHIPPGLPVEAEHEESQPTREAEVPLSEQRRHRSVPWWLIVSIILVGGIVGGWFYVQSLHDRLAQQEVSAKTKEERLNQMQTELDQKNAILAFLRAPHLRIIPLTGSAAHPRSAGSLALDLDKKDMLVHFSNLSPAPEGKEYWLWAFADRKTVRAGRFPISDEKTGESYVDIQPFDAIESATIDSFSVTLESQENVGRPTGEIYLHGKPLRAE